MTVNVCGAFSCLLVANQNLFLWLPSHLTALYKYICIISHSYTLGPRLTYQFNLLSVVIAEQNFNCLHNYNVNYSIGTLSNYSLVICVFQYPTICITDVVVLHYRYISSSYSLTLCNLVL